MVGFLYCLVGFILGVVVCRLIVHIPKKVGNIYVTSDEDGTYLSLQIKQISDITDQKVVSVNVRTR